jgi:hypothetical protein
VFLENIDDDVNTRGLRCESGKKKDVFDLWRRDKENDD